MRIIALSVLSLLFAQIAAAQTASTDAVIDQTRLKIAEYRETFANLICDETKTFERVNAEGRVKKRSAVVSDLLVYRANRPGAESSELRVIKQVDGKAVPDARSRGEKLLAELAKTTVALVELNKLQDESTRYDRSVRIYGATLNQASVLNRKIAPSLDFEVGAETEVAGHKVLPIRYLQRSPNPFIAFNPRIDNGAFITINVELPDGSDASELRLRGTIFVDKETFRIRREERDVVLEREMSQPLLSSIHEYADTEFGALLPSRISFTINTVERKKGALVVESRISAVFTYSNYRRTNVDIKITDADPDPQP